MENKYLTIPLWPDGAPGSETWEQIEKEIVWGEHAMPLVQNITQPTLTVYPAEKPNGAAVIVAPGGAFRFLAIEHEGRQVAEWLSARGITAFILKYRVRRTGDEPWLELAGEEQRNAEMQALLPMTHADASQAMCLVRQRAAEWGVDPTKVGFMGFSAGAIVTSQLTLDHTPETRPAFAAPIYGAPWADYSVPQDAPPLFLLCAQDDEWACKSSLRMFSAWQEAKKSVEMHLYERGGHGFGMRPGNLPCNRWIERFADWLNGLGII